MKVWNLLNAVWPGMWGNDEVGLDPRIHKLLMAIGDFQRIFEGGGVSREDQHDFQRATSQFWEGREVWESIPNPGFWDDHEQTYYIGEINTLTNGVQFIFHDCGGYLEISFENAPDYHQLSDGKPIRYTVKWVTSSCAPLTCVGDVYARNVVMAYLLSGADGYMTFVTDTKSVTTKKIEEALCQYFFTK